jgi:NitT/TauT family transport system substrate-binding protein
MMKRFINFAVMLGVVIMTAGSAIAAEPTKIGWSRYIGWELFGIMQNGGIMDKWNKKYGTNVQFVFVGDYADSVGLFATKQLNGIAVTNMDELTIAGTAGRKGTILYPNDFSNGNDVVGIKGFKNLKDAKEVTLVEYSVSHYVLARCAQKLGIPLKKFKTNNATDSDIPSIVSNATNIAYVTWNPMKLEIEKLAGTTAVCTSADFPGEVMDLLVIGDEVGDAERKALTGAWYDAVSRLMDGDPVILKAIADQIGTDVDSVNAQLKTTAVFKTPADALKFVNDTKTIRSTMEKVIAFSFDNGLYEGITDPKDVGVKFADGSVLGNPNNIMLVFDNTYIKMAAEGKIK